jgi:hypothetical protein
VLMMRRRRVPVPWRMVPRVVLMMRRRRVPVPRRMVPRVVLMMRRRRVPVPWRMVPRVVLMMRRRRVPVPRRMVPRVMMVRVEPVVIVMTPRGLMSRLRLLRRRDAAGATARAAAPRTPRAALRRSGTTMLAGGDGDAGAGRGCRWRDDDGLAGRRRHGRRCCHASVLWRGRRRRGVHLDDRVDRPAREREHAATADRAQCDGSEGAVAREHREAEDGRCPHAARPREHGRAFL